MAGMAHLGVGLAAKRVAPKTPVWVLIVAAYAIDIIWGIFFFAGIEHLPDPARGPTPWSHGLFMALIWSLLGGLAAWLLSRGNRRTALILGLMVFSHWVVDFISHPMTAMFPGDTGMLLLFEGSPQVGLGMWSTTLGVNIGEYGTLLVGLAIYILTIRQLRRQKQRETQVATA